MSLLALLYQRKDWTITEVASKVKYTEVISIITAKDGVIGDPVIAKEVEQWVVPRETGELLTGEGIGATQ